MTPELSDRHDVHPDDRDLERTAVDYLNPARAGPGIGPSARHQRRTRRNAAVSAPAGAPSPRAGLARPTPTPPRTPPRPGRVPTACGPGSSPTPITATHPIGTLPPNPTPLPSQGQHLRPHLPPPGTTTPPGTATPLPNSACDQRPYWASGGRPVDLSSSTGGARGHTQPTEGSAPFMPTSAS